eukprot:2686567-Pleurochrysis_carterae.AAC.1
MKGLMEFNTDDEALDYTRRVTRPAALTTDTGDLPSNTNAPSHVRGCKQLTSLSLEGAICAPHVSASHARQAPAHNSTTARCQHLLDDVGLVTRAVPPIPICR